MTVYGVWDVTDGDPPVPTTDNNDPVNGFYRINGTGTLHGVEVVSGDEIMYDVDADTWFRVGRDRDSYSKDDADAIHDGLRDDIDDAEQSAKDYTDTEITALPQSDWDTAYSRSVLDVSGSGNGTITIDQQSGSVSTDLSHIHGYSDLPSDIATEGYADSAANTAETNSNNYTDSEINSLNSSLSSDISDAENNAVSAANSYTDSEISSLDSSLSSDISSVDSDLQSHKSSGDHDSRYARLSSTNTFTHTQTVDNHNSGFRVDGGSSSNPVWLQMRNQSDDEWQIGISSGSSLLFSPEWENSSRSGFTNASVMSLTHNGNLTIDRDFHAAGEIYEDGNRVATRDYVDANAGGGGGSIENMKAKMLHSGYGTPIYTCDVSGSVTELLLKSGKEENVHDFGNDIYGAAISPEGYLLIGGTDDTVELRGPGLGLMWSYDLGNVTEVLRSTCYIPGGRFAAVWRDNNDDTNITYLDMGGIEITTTSLPFRSAAVAVDPDGNQYYGGAFVDPSIAKYDKDGNQVWHNTTGVYMSLFYDRHNHLLVGGMNDEGTMRIRITDPDTGDTISTDTPSGDFVYPHALTPDGYLVMTQFFTPSDEIRLVDPDDLSTVIDTISLPVNDIINTVTYDSHSNYYVVQGGERITKVTPYGSQVWDYENLSGDVLIRMPPGDYHAGMWD